MSQRQRSNNGHVVRTVLQIFVPPDNTSHAPYELENFCVQGGRAINIWMNFLSLMHAINMWNHSIWERKRSPLGSVEAIRSVQSFARSRLVLFAPCLFFSVASSSFVRLAPALVPIENAPAIKQLTNHNNSTTNQTSTHYSGPSARMDAERVADGNGAAALAALQDYHSSDDGSGSVVAEEYELELNDFSDDEVEVIETQPQQQSQQQQQQQQQGPAQAPPSHRRPGGQQTTMRRFFFPRARSVTINNITGASAIGVVGGSNNRASIFSSSAASATSAAPAPAPARELID